MTESSVGGALNVRLNVHDSDLRRHQTKLQGRGLIRWFKNKNYPTEMNNEQHLRFSREFSREKPKFSRFPGNFPGKIEILIIFPGNFPGKKKKLLFSREFSRENRKIYHFPGKFPGKSEQIDSKL